MGRGMRARQCERNPKEKRTEKKEYPNLVYKLRIFWAHPKLHKHETDQKSMAKSLKTHVVVELPSIESKTNSFWRL